VDVFDGVRKDVEDWIELREMGLRRVHVGLETGHDALLEWLHKPGSAEQSAGFVRTLESAGLDVSVIVMVGVGGTRFAEAHVRDTIALVERLHLTRGDAVYLSPFVEHPESTYARRAAAEGVSALDDDEREDQYRTLRDAIRRVRPGVTVSRYDLREFVY
jgi:radical SAM superfamily enzyme YgiQ (UPF0313 family)